MKKPHFPVFTWFSRPHEPVWFFEETELDLKNIVDALTELCAANPDGLALDKKGVH